MNYREIDTKLLKYICNKDYIHFILLTIFALTITLHVWQVQDLPRKISYR